MLSTKPDWVLRRVKQMIPPPDALALSVQLLFDEFGSLPCSHTNRPLFDDEAYWQADNVLSSIRRGDVSDPPGISFYVETGRDANQLPLYRCTRGINSLEGGVHTNIVRKFAFLGAGSHFTDCVLADYRLRHNIRVSLWLFLEHSWSNAPYAFRSEPKADTKGHIAVIITHGLLSPSIPSASVWAWSD